MEKKLSLGEILREARTLKNVTLREVEEQTKISNTYLSQMELGGVKEPSPNKLRVLAEFYEIEYRLLMEAVGYSIPNESETKQTHNIRNLLLSQQKVTSEELEILVAFLMQYRKIRTQNSSSNKRRA
jgi:transcriptional regulator with XRE-family HTH domain